MASITERLPGIGSENVSTVYVMASEAILEWTPIHSPRPIDVATLEDGFRNSVPVRWE
jgi:hypothetical protein